MSKERDVKRAVKRAVTQVVRNQMRTQFEHAQLHVWMRVRESRNGFGEIRRRCGRRNRDCEGSIEYAASAFFPTHDPISSLLLAVGTFGVGFFARPIGRVAARQLHRPGRQTRRHDVEHSADGQSAPALSRCARRMRKSAGPQRS
ncbi:hypothetical protein PWR63_22935 [Paraburkholderia sp. A2WS-5]